jgi:hypothetical protein
MSRVPLSFLGPVVVFVARVDRLDADHFAFVPRCNRKGKLLASLLCKHGGAEREQLHAATADAVTPFLAGTMVRA